MQVFIKLKWNSLILETVLIPKKKPLDKLIVGPETRLEMEHTGEQWWEKNKTY